MKQRSSHTLSIFIISVTILAFLAGTYKLTTQSAEALACQNPPSNGRQYAWPPGTAVTVNLSPNFTSAQRRALQTAFNNWANLGGTGVTFTVTFNSTPISGVNTYQVNS
jgi:hypothetical protein